MKSKSVCIVGANSFLAGYLIDVLKGGELVEVMLCGRRPITDLPPNFNFLPFDVPNAPLNFSRLLDYSTIIYTAGAGIQQKENLAELMFELNTFLPIRIIEYLRNNRFSGTFISFGSYFEIGSCTEKIYFSEDNLASSLLSVPNTYCTAKRLLTRYYCSASVPFRYYHFILPTIYGPGEHTDRLIPYLIKKINHGEDIMLTGGDQTRQYVFAGDVALCLLQLESSLPPGIYNFPSTETCTVRQLVDSVYNQLNGSANIVFGGISRSDEQMKFLLLNSKKFTNQVQWNNCTDMKKVLPLYQPINTLNCQK